MPELPEVETVCRELAPLVKGRRISGFELFWEKTLRNETARAFERLVYGRIIQNIYRRGKYLVFELGENMRFSVHFKMTGSFLWASTREQHPLYTRAIIKLDDGASLYFIDPRKFGRIEPVGRDGGILKELGPEPLEDAFSVEVLASILAGRKTAIKAVLLDQRCVAGIGNMYADEALFFAGIHPLKQAASLNAGEISALHQSIQQVLRLAIERKGATVSDYTRPGGQAGQAQTGFKVAHRRGQSCLDCNSRLQRITVGQRGTYYCPVCQPAG